MIHPTTNNKTCIRVFNNRLKYNNWSCWEENIEKTYSHKLSSATFSIGELWLKFIPSHVVAETKLLESVVGVWRGLSTSSKSLASFSNAKMWQLDEWVALIEEFGGSTILQLEYMNIEV